MTSWLGHCHVPGESVDEALVQRFSIGVSRSIPDPAHGEGENHERRPKRMPWIATWSFLLGERPAELGVLCSAFGNGVTWPAKTSTVLSELVHPCRQRTSCGCFCYLICTLWRPWQPPTGPPTACLADGLFLVDIHWFPCKSSKSLTKKGPPPSPQRCETESQAYGLAS
jgi:hypothetical protein